MGMVDKTGQPRSDKDIQEAIGAVKECIIKHAIVLPLFTLHAGMILDCLRELQQWRQSGRSTPVGAIEETGSIKHFQSMSPERPQDAPSIEHFKD